MKLSRRAQIGLLSIVLIVAISVPVFAWIASNVLHFETTLVGSPFALTVLDNYADRNVLSPPYLPVTMYYEQPVVLYTNTKNLASATYNNVNTNYKIWRSGGLAMDTAWVTINIIDAAHPTGFDLPLALGTDPGLSAVADNVLVYSIGPYTAGPGFSADATVTVTLHNPAPLTTFAADVWVSVG
jgi:hypothetical protein